MSLLFLCLHFGAESGVPSSQWRVWSFAFHQFHLHFSDSGSGYSLILANDIPMMVRYERLLLGGEDTRLIVGGMNEGMYD